MKAPKWKAPTPDVTSSHSVRKLKVCAFCKKIGDSLLVIEPKKKFGHAYCIVTDGGLEALGALAAVEISKTTANDMICLGVKLDDILKLARTAERRERKASA